MIRLNACNFPQIHIRQEGFGGFVVDFGEDGEVVLHLGGVFGGVFAAGFEVDHGDGRRVHQHAVHAEEGAVAVYELGLYQRLAAGGGGEEGGGLRVLQESQQAAYDLGPVELERVAGGQLVEGLVEGGLERGGQFLEAR